jgi:spermidine/putrescine transport system substrate-binding protein
MVFKGLRAWKKLRSWGMVLALSWLVGLSHWKRLQRQFELQTMSEGGSVHLAVWSYSVPEESIASFEKETGIQVRLSHFSTNEELLAKLQAGGGEYDVILPSNYMLENLIELGLLRMLDERMLPRKRELREDLLSHPNPDICDYGLPYDFGMTGIGINRHQFKGNIQTWKDFFADHHTEGRFSLLDDALEVISAGLKANGRSIRNPSDLDLEKAHQTLLKARPHIRSFSSEPFASMLSGELTVSQIYSSEAFMLADKTEGAIDFVVPRDGASVWIDYLAIPKHASHPKEAHKLINYLLSQESGKALVETLSLGHSNQFTIELVKPSLKENKVLFPPIHGLKRFEILPYLGSRIQAYDRIWNELKAAPG